MELNEIKNQGETSIGFFLVFAAAFTVLPVSFLVLIIVTDAPSPIPSIAAPMLSIFLLIGIGFCITVGKQTREQIIAKRLTVSGKKTTAVFVDAANKKNSFLYSITYKFTNDKGETVYRTTKRKYDAGLIAQFKSAASFYITYAGNLSRITHSDTEVSNAKQYALFMKYEQEDKMFAVIKKEMDKELNSAARQKLLEQNKDLITPDTNQKLLEYIDFLNR